MQHITLQPLHAVTMNDAEVEAYVRGHRLDTLIAFEGASRDVGLYESVDPAHRTPFPAQWRDLVRLHNFVRQRKVTTILEFGVGKSTQILAHALAQNRQEHGAFVYANLRRTNAFELHSLDDMPEFIEVARCNIPPALREVVRFHYSPSTMTSFRGRICTLYEQLPNIAPDFIYLDAPSQFSVKGEVRGITTDHRDRMPMSADLLTIEHFLLPGTLVDGRTANARFLKANFQRNWLYQHLEGDDVHLFELAEAPLGDHNRRQIEFCLGAEWLEQRT